MDVPRSMAPWPIVSARNRWKQVYARQLFLAALPCVAWCKYIWMDVLLLTPYPKPNLIIM
ncbi:hypothetical protein BDV34DRAFT_190480, partial [Aspergillus parasiticus]